MDIIRQGEIARELLRLYLRKRGLSTFSRDELKREIGNAAKTIGISAESLEEFTEIIIRELVDELFKK